ncbi:aminodeoxychorismate synthase component I [Streptococcus sp. DD12]|uniref:aminodeoxychorismate synthase component I n=1 Tax=Streptococcus sp. DD12 TaxID=1777880 RepID=UPI000795BA2C|nr:aminodeoxychorismate synthase component I [Streptococcus sp. DD12]KXT76395.1 Para-aminobenzoate synthase, aminase component / Aminodeoxychorismate lyase [Streptococcus sp. DD12]
MHHLTIIDFKPLKERLIFTDPLLELKTSDLSQVKGILDKAENYQKQGFYVVGYLAYEAAKAFDPLFTVHAGPLQTEYLAYFSVHRHPKRVPFPTAYRPVDMPKTWQSAVSQEAYKKAISQIKNHLRQGDSYQVNYTIPLSANLTADALAIYEQIRLEQDAQYNAYIAHDDQKILSISPELFFERQGSHLLTRPMKGTIARGISDEDDLSRAEWLAQDAKNRAENMMIVDLLRNDMNRISLVGSEKVPHLCQVEQYATVWQMTSTITTELRENTQLATIFSALFPCGSITGAPKIATMAIIHALEPNPRGVYCGTIGVLLPDGNAIFNVAIRTLQVHKQEAIYGVGGGITWMSDWKSEYQETKEKAQVLYQKHPKFDLITTARLENGQVSFANDHLKRLKKASRYFHYPFDEKQFWQAIAEVQSQTDPHQSYRLRLALSRTGDLQVNTDILTPLPETFLQAKLVLQTKDLANPFTHFKTSYRPHLPKSSHEIIFFDEKGNLLETTIGNLIVEKDGQKWTPPADLDILNGIFRQKLVTSGRVKEKYLKIKDLKDADAIYACNAVRGCYPLTLDLEDET